MPFGVRLVQFSDQVSVVQASAGARVGLGALDRRLEQVVQVAGDGAVLLRLRQGRTVPLRRRRTQNLLQITDHVRVVLQALLAQLEPHFVHLELRVVVVVAVGDAVADRLGTAARLLLRRRPVASARPFGHWRRLRRRRRQDGRLARRHQRLRFAASIFRRHHLLLGVDHLGQRLLFAHRSVGGARRRRATLLGRRPRRQPSTRRGHRVWRNVVQRIVNTLDRSVQPLSLLVRLAPGRRRGRRRALPRPKRRRRDRRVRVLVVLRVAFALVERVIAARVFLLGYLALASISFPGRALSQRLLPPKALQLVGFQFAPSLVLTRSNLEGTNTVRKTNQQRISSIAYRRLSLRYCVLVTVADQVLDYLGRRFERFAAHGAVVWGQRVLVRRVHSRVMGPNVLAQHDALVERPRADGTSVGFLS